MHHAPRLARVAGSRTTTLLRLLGELGEPELEAPSGLPGWSRLAVVCHLRYGAAALLRMTRDALEGRETAYYPEGRARQRPATLRPAPHEAAADVLEDWRAVALARGRRWRRRRLPPGCRRRRAAGHDPRQPPRLLALLLGRRRRGPLQLTGDVGFAPSFPAAFPGP